MIINQYILEKNTILLNYRLMPVFHKKSSKILFMHVPKTAGSTFSNTLIKHKWKESFAIKNNHVRNLYHLKCSPQHYHAEIIDQILRIDSFDKKIMICRDPFTRLKSEYYWQLNQNISSTEMHSPKDWFKEVINSYNLDQFVFDNHIRPQVDFIIPGIKIFRFEEGIKKATNYALSNKLNESENIQNMLTKMIMNLRKPIQNKTSKKIEHIENLFLEIKDLVIDFYSEDYDYFKYS